MLTEAEPGSKRRCFCTPIPNAVKVYRLGQMGRPVVVFHTLRIDGMLRVVRQGTSKCKSRAHTDKKKML